MQSVRTVFSIALPKAADFIWIRGLETPCLKALSKSMEILVERGYEKAGSPVMQSGLFALKKMFIFTWPCQVLVQYMGSLVLISGCEFFSCGMWGLVP